MKVVFVCQRYYPYYGGVETHVQEVSERLVKKGLDVEVYTTDPEGKLSVIDFINGVKITRFRSFAPTQAYYFPSLKMLETIRNCSADIVHAHTVQAFPLFFAAIAKSETVPWKLVLTPHYHGPATALRRFLFSMYLPILKKIMAKADKIICVSKIEQKSLEEVFKLKADRLTVIPNGLNLEEIEGVKPHLKNGSMNILFVGRLERYKNADKVVRAAALLRHEYGLKNLRMVIVGDGPEKSNIIKLLRETNLENCAEIKSNLSRQELLNEYAKASVFVLPSLHEAYGISAMEAIAMGIPTILANSTALSGLIKQGLGLGIEPPITAQKIVDAVLSLDRHPFIKRDISDCIIGWDEVSNRLAKVYSNLFVKEAPIFSYNLDRNLIS